MALIRRAVRRRGNVVTRGHISFVRVLFCKHIHLRQRLPSDELKGGAGGWGGRNMSSGANCNDRGRRNITAIYHLQRPTGAQRARVTPLRPSFLFFVFSFSNQLIYTMQTVEFFHMTTKRLHKKRKTIAEHFPSGIKENSSQRRHIFHFLFARRKAAALEGRVKKKEKTLQCYCETKHRAGVTSMERLKESGKQHQSSDFKTSWHFSVPQGKLV